MIHTLHGLVESEHRIAKIFRAVVHTSVYLAFGGIGLAVFSTIALGFPHQIGAYAISFLMIFAMYNMNRYSDIKEDIVTHPKRHSFVIKYRKYIQISAILAVLISLSLAYLKNYETVFLTILPAVLAICYSFKLLPKNFKYRRLKDIPLMKNVVVAFSWAVITTGIVTAYSGAPFTLAVFCVGMICFTRFFINTVIFDMRDVHGDKLHGTETLPVLLGIKNSKIFLYTVLFLLVISTFILVQNRVLPQLVHLVNLTFIQAVYYIFLSDKKVPLHTVCDVVADGEFVLMGFAAILGRFILPY